MPFVAVIKTLKHARNLTRDLLQSTMEYLLQGFFQRSLYIMYELGFLHGQFFKTLNQTVQYPSPFQY